MTTARRPFFFVASVAAVLGYGCSSGGDGPTCSLASGCPDADQICQFTLGDCSGNGTCVSSTRACDDVATEVCTCGGISEMASCSNLAFEEPTRAKGVCPIATGGVCRSDDDCAPAALCAFPIAGGCGVTGTCVLALESCTDPTPEPEACACDGVTPIGLACIYGVGAAPLPVGTLGPCPGTTTDAGGDLHDGDVADGGRD
jgi:hypothetical protein